MENVYEIVFDGTKMNDYIRGRISGIMYMLVRKPDGSFPWGSRDGGDRWIVKTQCSQEVFEEIIKTIERVYWGVIIKTKMVS